MRTLPDLLQLDAGTRLTDIGLLPPPGEVTGASGRIVMHTAVGVSEPGSVAGWAASSFLPASVVIINGVQPDGRDWFTIFEHASHGRGTSTEGMARDGLDRALDLTGLGVDLLRTHSLTWDDLHEVYADLGIDSVQDWSILDLLLGLVINLTRGNLAGVVESVTDDSLPLEARPAHRHRRMDAALREWATDYQGPGDSAHVDEGSAAEKFAAEEFETLRDLVMALRDGDCPEDDADVVRALEDYIWNYLEDDLGWLAWEGEEAFSLFAGMGVSMWALECPFTGKEFVSYLDTFDIRIQRYRSISDIPSVGAWDEDDESAAEGSIPAVFAELFGANEADVVDALGTNWRPLDSDAVGRQSQPEYYLLWNDQLVVGLDSAYVNIFVADFTNDGVEAGDWVDELDLGDEETVSFEEFSTLLRNALERHGRP